MLSKNELKKLKEILDDAAEYRDLTDFEKGFVASLRLKLNEYGEQWTITERQQEIIDQIEQKIYRIG